MTLPKLLVSFSGGKSSAFMAKKLKDEYSDQFDMVFVFANTGCEWEQTLEFADRCDREWGLGLVWVEAVVHQSRIGCTHKIVNFQTASRNGEPFEAVIQKYGIPNKAYPHCTRELKLNPIRSYMESIGSPTGTYLSAVGIRSDEPRRIRKKAPELGIIYPMANMFPTDKPIINQWWDGQTFNLQLQDHQGNCKWCWKKSLFKHVRIYKETPEAFDFPSRMEQMYGLYKDGRKRVFFRGNISTQQLIQIATEGSIRPVLDDPDENAGCSESCEAFGMEEMGYVS